MEAATADGGVLAAPAGTASEGGRMGRNLAALASGQIVTWTMTLAWTLVVPRVLGPTGIGLFFSAWAVANILAIVLGFGTRNYLVRAIVVDRAEAPRLVGTAIILRLLMTPVFAGAILLWAHFTDYGPDGALVLYLAGGAMVLILLAEPMQAAFQAIERMEYLAYSDVLTKSAQGLLGIVLALVGLGAAGMMGCWLVVAGVVVVLDVVWLHAHVAIDLRTSVARLKDMARQSVAYWAFGLFFMIYLWIDSAMLSLLTSPEVVGWYAVPMRLFQSLMFLPVVVSTAWLPRLVEAYQRAPAELHREARRPLELVVVLGVPIAAGIAVTAGPLIGLLYGPAYAHSVPVMVILGLCIPPMYLSIMLSQVVIAAGRQVTWTWVMAGATIVNPALNAVLIPLTQHALGNGAIGAAISLLATEAVIVTVGLAIVGRGVVDRRGVRRCGLTIVASTGAWAVSSVVAHPLGSVAAGAAAAVAFVVLAAVLQLVTPEEWMFIRSRLGRLRTAAARRIRPA